MILEYNREIDEALTEKKLLKKIGMSKKDMLKLLHGKKMQQAAEKLAGMEEISCQEVLSYARPVLDQLCPEPDDGWLMRLFADGKHILFPENFDNVMEPCHESGKLFYMACLNLWLRLEQESLYRPTAHFLLATEEEQQESSLRDEYTGFLDFLNQTNFIPFMRIAAEVTPFNTCGHIAGVHHVAMHMARQLKKAGSPVDPALMSAAAIGHDIGKFGCKDSEARRVPYLHYYYTDLCLKRFNMPGISYIAANHSTWDLELENLSLESLLLIYADFRVKSTRENGREIIHFYSLKDSFDVILGKLDNVDDAKKKRYIRVYGKLVDFENYMLRLGVHTDLVDLPLDPPAVKNPVLDDGVEIIGEFKNTAVTHNVNLMHALNSEATFTNILEMARSDKDWKSTRTYLNIIREYCTYMNQRQKLLTLNFLYELLMHHESDIRDTAANLMGWLIAGFDIEYRKELPEGKSLGLQEITGAELFEQFIKKILIPDHKITDQHRRWLGYKLETLCGSVLSECRSYKREEYLRVMVSFYEDLSRDRFTALCMIHNLSMLDTGLYTEKELQVFIPFCLNYAEQEDTEVRLTILDYMNKLLVHYPDSGLVTSGAYCVLDLTPDNNVPGIDYLKYKIRSVLYNGEDSWTDEMIQKRISRAFLDNLKNATPWIAKVINIRFLLDQVHTGANRQPIHTVTHMANLMTAADCIDVREAASDAILDMTNWISGDSYVEVAVELLQILEIGEKEFSRNIPYTLAQLILKMQPSEMDEFLVTLEHMLITAGDSAACETLDTIGVMLEYFPAYESKFPVQAASQRDFLLGLLLRGMVNDHLEVSREAQYIIGEALFGTTHLTLEKKYAYFCYLARKAYHLWSERKEDQISFLINAASFNHIYRFISEYILEYQHMEIPRADKVAFFPGTFDPFSLSHKGIVQAIRDLGYEVYLAIDEFSWSKKTQPRLLRRKIAAMSTAADCGVFLFPDDVSVNIANPKDLKGLRELFPDRSLYIVAGSDVTAHASAYRKAVEPDSIHNFNHVIFRRTGDDYDTLSGNGRGTSSILGNVVELTLPVHLEDISSTRIRDNIDLNRDISNLIDPMVQRFIYENNLYMREPQYKPVLMMHPITAEIIHDPEDSLWDELQKTILRKKDHETILRRIRRDHVTVTLLRDQEHDGRPVSMAISRIISSGELHDEFESMEVTKEIRSRVRGQLLYVEGIYAPEDSEYHDYFQMVVTELLAYYLEREVGYCIYHGRREMDERRSMVDDTLVRQGFVRIESDNDEETIMIASMHRPYIITGNIETVIKTPFNTNPAVRKVLAESHRRLQTAIAAFSPGHLTLSFDATVMHYRLMNKITQYNHVPNVEVKPRLLGDKMCVPFGKMLRGSITPNTVTKALHTEKIYQNDMSYFDVEEYPGYSPLKDQIRMIQSFDRDVILVDDILHSGERLRKLQKLLDESEVRVSKILTGIMTANGRDQVYQYDYTADCVYFIPDLRAWFVESTLYPFIGGDSIRTSGEKTAGLLTSINLILPYVAPNFLLRYDIDKVFDMSMICLENAAAILKVLEDEYQKAFERNLTLDRLGEVILSPTCPDEGAHMTYDPNLPASAYVKNDIIRLGRLRGVARERN